MKTKRIKVQYSSRFSNSGYQQVPKIQIEGNWLENLGFSVGTQLMLEYENGSIRIRPLTLQESLILEESSLNHQIATETKKLHSLKQALLHVAETPPPYHS